MNLLGQLFEGVVENYKEEERICEVSIKGMTDKSEDLYRSQVMFSIGDNSLKTSIDIENGDLVWIQFINGDARYPIIVGYRCPKNNNRTGVRYWKLPQFILDGKVTITGDLEVTGNVIFNGDSVKHGDKEIGKSHKHSAGNLKDSQGKSCSDDTDSVE